MDGSIVKLRYGNTNTFFISGKKSGLLVDTDYAGSLSAFYRTIKSNGIDIGNIGYVMATHYHPDHMGLIGELMRTGTRLLLIDLQKDSVNFSDRIFERDGIRYFPVQEDHAVCISCRESRSFLAQLGIEGEIIHTPSHSADSVSLILDEGVCFVGDLDPLCYSDAYEDSNLLKKDWDNLMDHHPNKIFYGHINESLF